MTAPTVEDLQRDILRCPFCRGACAITSGYSSSELPWSDDGGAFHRVYCTACQSRQLYHRTPEEAVAAWNRRAEPDEAAERERFEAWANSVTSPVRRPRTDSDGSYRDFETEAAWQAWLTRASESTRPRDTYESTGGTNMMGVR